MTQTAKISFRMSCASAGLRFTAQVDDQIIFQGDPLGEHTIEAVISDDDGSHCLTLTLEGKTSEHTKIDDDGKILEDITVAISDISFDDIELGHLATLQARYRHDFNGTADSVEEKFYGVMGCNGTVTLPFTTPIYLWLLENM